MKGIKASKNATTPNSDFIASLESRWQLGNFVCVGLDSDYEKIPRHLKGPSRSQTIVTFNAEIVDATADIVCAYKLNSAFYEAKGKEGFNALKKTIANIKDHYPDIPVIFDAKRGDIGNTNIGFVEAAFDILGADAITVHPYLGREALEPFLQQKNKGILVVARTSNPGAGEFQDLLVGEYQEPLYRVVARQIASEWNTNGNVGIVVGATYPKELADVRAIVGDMPILIPGIGAQGGGVKPTVEAGKDSRGHGMIINSSRGIIFASDGRDFADAARIETQKLSDQINQYR